MHATVTEIVALCDTYAYKINRCGEEKKSTAFSYSILSQELLVAFLEPCPKNETIFLFRSVTFPSSLRCIVGNGSILNVRSSKVPGTFISLAAVNWVASCMTFSAY